MAILDTGRVIYEGSAVDVAGQPSAELASGHPLIRKFYHAARTGWRNDVDYSQTGSGPDLLLLHSLLTDDTVFERVLLSLASAHRVTCINLPGFGASAPVALHTVADYADRVAATMDALQLPPSTDLFGNGFGAFVALEVAIRHGARVGNLIVADVVAAFPEPARAPFRAMAAKVRESGMGAVLDTAIGRMFPPAFQARAPEVVARRKERLARVDPECFDVSKSPVRDALSRLVQEGLVIVMPRQGYRVAPISVKDVRDMFQYRAVLEGASDAALRALDRFRVFDRQAYPDGFISYNRDFHHAVAALCGNARLMQAAAGQIDQMDRVVTMSVDAIRGHDPARVVRQHEDIIDALQRRDGRRASTLMARHVLEARRRVVSALSRIAIVV